jgi:hypothetical protein
MLWDETDLPDRPLDVCLEGYNGCVYRQFPLRQDRGRGGALHTIGRPAAFSQATQTPSTVPTSALDAQANC